MYPCDLLFVHRDAERESIEQREKEIRESLEKSAMERTPPVVRVIPVRMQEAWLLARKIRGVFRFRYRHKSPRVVQVQC